MNINGHDMVGQYFDNVRAGIGKIDQESVHSVARLLLEAYDEERMVFIFGNGGSAANASHFCGDMLKGASYGRQKGFRMVCLADNVPAVMAIANDISYDAVFVAQLQYLMRPGDLVIGISGSGNSPNVLKAIEFAKKHGAKTVGLCGFKGGKLNSLAEHSILVPVDDMEVVEDAHLAILHCLKRTIMQELDAREGRSGGPSC